MNKISIIGRGFVGSALEQVISEAGYEVYSYDIKDSIDIQTGYRMAVEHSPVIYLCLPTPSGEGGDCDTSIVEEACLLIHEISSDMNKVPLLLIKSTLKVGTISRIQQSVNPILICNPEFLTERTAYKDCKNPSSILVGIPAGHSNPFCLFLSSFHKKIWPMAKLVFTEIENAELIKQMTNTFFSLKITFANHMRLLCDSLNIKYEEFIRSALLADGRLGEEHWKVPGPDGKFGFGGHCLPKDLKAMIKTFEQNNVPTSILNNIEDFNQEIRTKKEEECQQDLIKETFQLLRKIFFLPRK